MWERLTTGAELDPLEKAAHRYLTKGYRVESRTETMIVLARPKRPSHGLHVVLSILTLGMWLPVYLVVLFFARDRYVTLRLTASGRVTERHRHRSL